MRSDASRMPSRRWAALPRWYEWLVASVLLLAAVAHFVIRPAAESLLQGVGQIAGSLAQGIGTVLEVEYQSACWTIEHDPLVTEILGAPIACPPIEQVQWLDSQGRQELAYRFPVTGTRASGEAHVICTVAGDHLQPTSITVTTADTCVLVPTSR